PGAEDSINLVPDAGAKRQLLPNGASRPRSHCRPARPGPTISAPPVGSTFSMPGHSLDAVAARLRRELTGEVLFDAGSRGRYSTDASIYQIEPLGVVVPRTTDEAIQAAEIAVSAGVPVLPRGAGTSQCGQTVGAALVLD